MKFDMIRSQLMEETFPMEAAGLDEDLRDLDSMWNAVLVQKVVTEEETARMIQEQTK